MNASTPRSGPTDGPTVGAPSSPIGGPIGDAKAWSAKSIGGRFQHGFFYALVRLFGLSPAYAFLYCVTPYYALLHPEARRRGRDYLARRFPKDGGTQRKIKQIKLFVELGKCLLDRAAVGMLGDSAIRVEFPERDALFDLARSGRGLVLVSAHVGPWQSVQAMIGRLPAPVHLVVLRERGDQDKRFHEHRGEAPPFSYIDPDGAALTAHDALTRGEIVWFMGDRVFGGRRATGRADFLGAPAYFPLGPYALARLAHCPLGIVFSRKTGPRSHSLRLEALLEPPIDSLDRRFDVERGLALFVDRLSSFVHEHPFQFFNFHNLWRNPFASSKNP